MQLLEHDVRDTEEVFLRQMVEGDDLVHTVEKFRPQEALQCLHGLLLHLVAVAAAKAHAADISFGTGVGGHDNDGVLEVHHPALGVRNASVVQHLKQNVQHIRVRLFDFVKQHHAVGTAANLLRQLSGLIIAHIAGRRTDELGDGVLLHIFRHVQPNQAVHIVKQVACQLLDQFRLAHAGGADENKGHRPLLGGNAHPVAADGTGHGVHRLVLHVRLCGTGNPHLP